MASFLRKARHAKTAVVKAVVPQPVKNVVAGAALYGRSIDARARGWTEVADRMQAKAGQWAIGNRAEPDPKGNWTGNNTDRFMPQSSNIPPGARRSPERAAAVLDRAARMGQFKPGWFDQRLGDRQMRTPGKVDAPFRIERLPEGVLKKAEIADIPLKSVVTEQPTVSVATVKSKLPGLAGGSTRTPPVIRHGGQYYLADGNHDTTGMRALGMKSGKFQVYDLDAEIKPPMVSPKAIRTAGRVTQMVGAPLAVGSMAAIAYQNRLAQGGSTGEAIVDGAVAGGRTAATGVVMGGLIKGAKAIPALRGAASFASRALLPLSIAGHAAGYAYGAWQRGESGGDIAKAAGWGAVNGIVPIDLVREAFSGGGDTHEAQQFAQADRAYRAGRAQQSTAPDSSAGGGKRRGWSNAARISAAQSRGAQVLPYGGNPDSGPDSGRSMQE